MYIYDKCEYRLYINKWEWHGYTGMYSEHIHGWVYIERRNCWEQCTDDRDI